MEVVVASTVASLHACTRTAPLGMARIVVQLGGISSAATAAADARSTSPGATTLSDPSAPSASYPHASRRSPSGLLGNAAREDAADSSLATPRSTTCRPGQ